MNGDIEYYESGNFLFNLGAITYLSLHSKLHASWYVGDLINNVIPALEKGSFRIYRSTDHALRAFVTWAFFDDETHAALQSDGLTPSADKWQIDGHLWIMDFVAPFGDAKTLIADLKHNVFPERLNAYSIHRSSDGEIRRKPVWVRR